MYAAVHEPTLSEGKLSETRNEPNLEELLLALLAQHNIDRRYYGFFEAHRNVQGTLIATDAQRIARDLLAARGHDAALDAKEGFLRFRSEEGDYEFVQTIAFNYGSQLELILLIRTPGGETGGTLHGLARKVGLWRDASFRYNPRYPRLPFGDEASLRSALTVALDLFADIRSAVVNAQLGAADR